VGKSQGLPISTVVLIVIVVVVMVALLMWFFTSFAQSGAGVQTGIEVTNKGAANLSNASQEFFKTWGK